MTDMPQREPTKPIRFLFFSMNLKMVIEILNGGEILVNQFEFVPRDSSEFKPRALLLKSKKAVAVSITMVKTPIVASYGRKFFLTKRGL